MDENAKSAPVSSGRWLALIVAAVILAEGIWAMLVSVTRSLILPLIARITGGDAQSALYLGKGEVNIPDLFGSVLQICLAALVFLIIKSWRPRGSRGKAPRPVKASKPGSSLSVAPQPIAPQSVAPQSFTPQPIAPPLMAPQPVTPTAQAAAASAVPAAQPPAPAAVPPAEVLRPSPEPPQRPPKPAKPEKPKEVYYNIVGEPMSPEDE